MGFETEEKLLLKPFSCYIKCFSLPYLFAGKMHAILFRKGKNNVKGRDWYDLEWYVRKGVPLDLNHFAIRAKDSGDIPEGAVTEEDFRKLLAEKIDTVNMDRVRADISRFIPDQQMLDLWSPKYFHDLAAHLSVRS